MAGQQVSPQAVNGAQRAAVLAAAVSMSQTIYTANLNSAQQSSPVQVQPRNVGLIKNFQVRITATVTNNDTAHALTLTDFGLANLLSNITFTDLNNNQRINTAGWHLSMLNSIKERKPAGAGYMIETDAMGDYGETYPILSSPQTIAAATAGQPNIPTVAIIAGVFTIPLAYNDDDLRGSVYANVVNATMQLSMQLNQNAFAAAGADSTFAVYKGTTNATLSNVTFEVYQNYLDQLPIGQGGVILPILDLSTIYELKTSAFNNIAQAQDFAVPFANFRDFLSTLFIFNHDTSGDVGRVAGSDINFLALQSANFTNIWKKSPLMQSLDTRSILGCDLPKGAYYYSSRRRPISTVQFGNMELIINPSVSSNNSAIYVGWEDFALVNTLTQAGSLAG